MIYIYLSHHISLYVYIYIYIYIYIYVFFFVFFVGTSIVAVQIVFVETGYTRGSLDSLDLPATEVVLTLQ